MFSEAIRSVFEKDLMLDVKSSEASENVCFDGLCVPLRLERS